MSKQWKLVPVEPTQPMLDGMTTERKKGNGVLQMWFEALAAAPVPPAGGEVEVLVQARSVGDRIPSAWADIRDSVELEQMQRTNALCEARDTLNCYEFRELVDRAHVTRLQAENAALQQSLTVADQRVDDLETELTKAVDLLNTSYQLFGLNNSLSSYRAQMDDIVEFVAEQLARTEQCQFPQACTITCGCKPEPNVDYIHTPGSGNKARRRIAALSVDQDIDPFKVCLECFGTGSICTGIMESSNTICNACDGVGREPS